jgi:hypothetical protein
MFHSRSPITIASSDPDLAIANAKIWRSIIQKIGMGFVVIF